MCVVRNIYGSNRAQRPAAHSHLLCLRIIRLVERDGGVLRLVVRAHDGHVVDIDLADLA